MTPTHTPTPWQWDGDDLWHFGDGYKGGEGVTDPHRFAGLSIDPSLRESPVLAANKALIVERVNGWDALKADLAWEKERRAQDLQGMLHLVREKQALVAERDQLKAALDELRGKVTDLQRTNARCEEMRAVNAEGYSYEECRLATEAARNALDALLKDGER